MKDSLKRVTVQIALLALTLQLICLFLPWYTQGDQSMSAMEAIEEKSEYFAGILPLFIVGLLLVAILFATNHPKLSLIGDVPLALVFGGFIVTGMDYGLDPGVGTFLYAGGLIICILCAFLTKKLRKNRSMA